METRLYPYLLMTHYHQDYKLNCAGRLCTGLNGKGSSNGCVIYGCGLVVNPIWLFEIVLVTSCVVVAGGLHSLDYTECTLIDHN